MRIIEGIKTKGKGVEIPDVGRRQLPGFLAKDMGFKVGVEIGVQRAYFTRRLARTGMKIYGVDPWLAYGDYRDGEKYQIKQDKLYQIALDNVKEFPNCELVRKTSMEAVKDFEDKSLDFVYIDGHHGFKYVTEDIFEWTKKVKIGGVISGHDYAYSKVTKNENQPYILQVKYVIDAYTKAFKIKNWWVLGRKHKVKEGERRDQYRSWFWFREY